MPDMFAPDQRSALMARIGPKDSRAELITRRLLHRLGYRFRLHRRDLPGNPDIVLPGRRKVIFLHGCFWHRHAGCRRASNPKSRQDYWLPKFDRTVARDQRNVIELEGLGWNVLTVWECETRNLATLQHRLIEFLGPVRETNPAGNDSSAGGDGSARRPPPAASG